MIQVRIPATTANLGPGFDCMGLALDLWNTFELRLAGDKGTASVAVMGEGENTLPTGEDNMVVRLTRELVGIEFEQLETGIQIRCHAGVPCASGLGSSSTAVLAACVFARAIRLKLSGVEEVTPELIDTRVVLKDAVAIEGHGDNVGPAMMGGLLLIMPKSSDLIVRHVPFKQFKVVVCVPEFDYLTVDARARLPKTVSHADAVFNLGRSMFVLHALTQGDEVLLAEACEDRLHEPYRLPDIPGSGAVREAALAAGASAVVLSGAGPGMLSFASRNHAEIGKAMQEAFAGAGLKSRWWAPDAVTRGATVSRLPSL